MNKRIKIVISAIILTITTFGISGCSVAVDSISEEESILLQPKEVKYSTYTVRKGEIKFKSRSTGDLTSSKEEVLYVPVYGGILEELNVDTWQEVKQGDVIAKLYSGDIEDEIVLQELIINKKLLEIEKLQSEGAKEYDTKLAKADLEIEREKLRVLERKKEESTLISPIDGVISSVTKADEGTLLGGLDRIAIIRDKESLLIQSVPRGMEHYTIGMNVDIEYMGKHYEGRVKEVNLKDDPSMNIVAGAIIEFVGDMPEDVRFGDRMEFTVFGETVEDAILVPTESVKTEINGEKYVLIDKNGVKNKKIVTTGIINSDYTEITSGLAEGDEIIVQ